MFGNLVESGSHLKDLKRRSSFFVATLVFYSVLLAAAGVGSIYAYNVHLDEQSELELTAMLRFAPPAARDEDEPQQRREVEPRRAAEQSAGRAGPQQVATVKHDVRNNPNLSNRAVAPPDAPELPPGTLYRIGDDVSIPARPGGGGEPNGRVPGASNRNGGGPLVPPDVEEVPERRTPAETTPKQASPPQVLKLSGGAIAGKVVSKPVPPYPALARQARASGTVAVQVLVDEQGRVVRAQATSGNPLLLKAAVEAAYRVRFSPTLLSNQPVKVTGVIYYNFVLN